MAMSLLAIYILHLSCKSAKESPSTITIPIKDLTHSEITNYLYNVSWRIFQLQNGHPFDTNRQLATSLIFLTQTGYNEYPI